MPPESQTESSTTSTATVRKHLPPVKDEKTGEYKSVADNFTGATQASRYLVVSAVALFIYFRAPLQDAVDHLWSYLIKNDLFCSAYFETIYVTLVYIALVAGYPFVMHYIPWVQKFKVSDDVTYVHRPFFGKVGMVLEMFFHLTPLLVADALKMKKYFDVPEIEWEKRRGQWIQTTRALPEHSPNVLLMCGQVIGSVIAFDAIFFVVHFILHKNFYLYKYFHSQHHDHDVMHPHVTNQLSVVERILQVASANYSLILFRSHPLSRLVFVPVFLWFLIENHTGYDLPWAPHRLIPHGVMGGPAKHHAHHQHGSRHYQPFFNYLDKWLENWQLRKKLA
ncbi:cholesterol 25-hydroxylase isoform X2 [Aplysia californica]|nr:cholesterol 25-hydroxylase isoform X2 [Aplysia californica]XP_005106896.1 cholesterol 25-hydroxylase isoform X2 [Aplysia californica]XP_035827909.1 cholesterol 25-hydroxylase isoform X2 [Aplysia californica]XP_035827910.1 cholesterol 25-hydroxylase isoform X2 [Aplysia californica]